MLNILVSINNSYLEHAITMLHSLNNNTSEGVKVYVLDHALDKSLYSMFEKVMKKKYNIIVNRIDVSETIFDDMPLGDKHFSVEMYYRILAQFILPKEIDRILWLDADIIINGDISDFYHQSFGNNQMIVCEDAKYMADDIVDIKKKLGLPTDCKYFNSGVLLLNLERLRKTTTIEEIMQMTDMLRDKLTYPDQDILNYLYYKKVGFEDWKKYNFQVGTVSKEEINGIKKAHIIHYTGKRKPWLFRYMNQYSKYYWRVKIKENHKFHSILIITLGLMYQIIHKKNS